MKFLAIETSSKQLGVALIEDDQLLSAYELLVEYPHAVELPDAVKRVLQAARTPMDDVAVVVVDVGPGSFTGLRIGLAFVKAFVFPTGTPLVGVPSLDVLAAGLPYATTMICPVLDAKQHNVYTACFRIEAGRLKRQTNYQLGRLDDVLPALEEPMIVLGDACTLYRERMLERCPQVEIATAEFWLPRAAILARLGRERFLEGRHDDPAQIVPLYLYPQDCQVRGPDRPSSVLPKVIQAA